MPSSISSADTSSASLKNVAGLHPATFVFVAVALVVMLSLLLSDPRPFRQGSAFFLGAGSVAAVLVADAARYRMQLWRTRWLLLMTTVVFSMQTPGAILGWLPLITADGLRLGLLQVAYLCVVLAVITLLSALLRPNQLASGISCVLAWFMRHSTASVRIGVRLALVLDGARPPHGSVSVERPQPVHQGDLRSADRVILAFAVMAVVLVAVT